MAKLTIRQEKFCREYIKDGNATRSYRAAYSYKNMKENTINRSAKALIDNPKLRTRITELQRPAIKKAKVTAERIIGELAKVAFFNPKALFNDDGTMKQITELDSEVTAAIQYIKARMEKQGANKEDWAEIKDIKTHDKLRALELLGKTLAMFTDKQEISGEISLTLKTAMQKVLK